MSFAIGAFRFISLSRVFSRPTHKLVREARPGVSGVTFWRTGKRAEPVQIASAVDAASVEQAEALIHAYELLVGADPVAVQWGGLDRPDILAIVHDVQPIENGVFKTLLGIGGTLGSSQAFVRASWTIEPIDPTVYL